MGKLGFNETIERLVGRVWFSLPDALRLIASVRGVDLNEMKGVSFVGINRALKYLGEADPQCCYGLEAAPHTEAEAARDEEPGEAAIEALFRGVAVLDLDRGVCQIGIKIKVADLVKYLELPRRGPRAGTVSRYSEADQALFSEIDRLIREGRAGSATAAAQQLDKDGKVAGTGIPKSRVARLAKAYLQRK